MADHGLLSGTARSIRFIRPSGRLGTASRPFSFYGCQVLVVLHRNQSMAGSVTAGLLVARAVRRGTLFTQT